MLSDEELFAWVEEEGRHIADRCEGRGDTVVPTCPDWTLADLVGHVGGWLSGWFAYNLRHDPNAPDVVTAFLSAAPLPESDSATIRYLRDGVGSFLARARASDLDASVWAFGRAEPARYWLRRAATELAVHAWDVAGAVGKPYVLSPRRAAGSVDEVIRGLWTRSELGPSPVPDPPDRSLGMRATDSSVFWMVRRGGSHRITVDSAPDPAPYVAVAGTGLQLVLWLYGRVPTSALEVAGPLAMADEWNLLPQVGF